MNRIELPSNAIAIAIDYKGDGKSITAVRYIPEDNKVIPQFQLNANPASKDYSQWRQIGLVRTQQNAQVFIAAKTKKAKRLWVITKDLRFVDIWEKSQGVIAPENIQLGSPVVDQPKVEAADVSPV